jgi:hypothetical protein
MGVKYNIMKAADVIQLPESCRDFIKMSVIFISDSRLCGAEGMRLGSSSSVVNKNQLIFISS